MELTKSKHKVSKKPSCPFGRHCITDSCVCGYIGYYAECQMVLKTEDREGMHEVTTQSNQGDEE